LVLTSTAAESYLWAPNGETTQSITVSTQGSYSVTVTDENGCTGESDPMVITVFDNPTPDITASGPIEFCEGDSVVLTSTEADTYLWSPNGETTQSITVFETGSYLVSVVDTNGCTGDAHVVNVTVFEVESVTIGSDGPKDFCEGEDVVLTASGVGPFLWSPNGETTASITVENAGIYTATVTDINGCATTSDSIIVTVFPNPEPDVTALGSTTFCEGDSALLMASESEFYEWAPNGENTQNITVFETGAYSVMVTDTNGCSGVSEETVVTVFEETEVSISADGPTAFCDGGEVTLTATLGQSYEWLPTGDTTASIVVTEGGTYTVSIIDVNGCSYASDELEVELFELPEVEVQADGPIEFCEGESVDLLAISPNDVTYQWLENGVDLTGETSTTLNVDDESIYSVVVTDTNGCIATAIGPILIIGPAPNASLGSDQWLCPEDSITLTATGGDLFLWNNGSTEASITVSPDEVSEYSVIVTNANCELSSYDTVIVSLYEAPFALIGADSLGLLENEMTFSDISGDGSIIGWDWDFGDGNYDDVQNPEHTFSTEEEFTVILTVENEFGCTDTDTIVVEVIQVIDIPNVFTPNDDGINDEVAIRNNGVSDYEITIYNRWGIMMHHDVSGEIFWDGRTPAGAEAKAGTYYYILKVFNEFSLGDFTQTGTVTLIR